MVFGLEFVFTVQPDSTKLAAVIIEARLEVLHSHIPLFLKKPIRPR